MLSQVALDHQIHLRLKVFLFDVDSGGFGASNTLKCFDFMLIPEAMEDQVLVGKLKDDKLLYPCLFIVFL